MNSMQIKRLHSGDTAIAVSLFLMMASVFGETPETLSLDYVEGLLKRNDFWAIAAVEDREPVAGLTAFTLPLTRSEAAGVLIYDIAVQPGHQRRGIGRALVDALKKLAAEAGIGTTWVPADNEDLHALEFYRAIGGKPTRLPSSRFPRECRLCKIQAADGLKHAMGDTACARL